MWNFFVFFFMLAWTSCSTNSQVVSNWDTLMLMWHHYRSRLASAAEIYGCPNRTKWQIFCKKKLILMRNVPSQICKVFQKLIWNITVFHMLMGHRADSRLVPGQWETSLQSNAISHWLGANLESALGLFLWYKSVSSVKVQDQCNQKNIFFSQNILRTQNHF